MEIKWLFFHSFYFELYLTYTFYLTIFLLNSYKNYTLISLFLKNKNYLYLLFIFNMDSLFSLDYWIFMKSR